jgi:hypothetical protein
MDDDKDKKEDNFTRCSRDGLYKPSKRINEECEEKPLCRKACADAICDVVDIFLDCPKESQPSIQLLLVAMDDEYKKECDTKLKCIPDFTPSSAFATSTPNLLLLSVLTVITLWFIAL